jgi:hypothetical protein
MPGPSSFPAFSGSISKILSNPVIGAGLNSVVPGAGTAANAAGSMMAGSNSGGGGFGSKLLGAIGSNPGYGLSLGMGAAKNLQANIQQKKANAMFPSAEDPELRMLATDFRRRKRAFQTGTAMTSELANQRALAKQGTNAAFNAGGGPAGLNRMQQLLSQAMLGNKQAGMQGEMFYAGKYGDVVNTLAQTRLQKAMAKYSQAQADAKQTKTSANRLTNLGLMGLMNTGETADVTTDYMTNPTMENPEENG